VSITLKKIQKKSIKILFVILLCLICFCHNTEETYARNSNKYLVLVQQKNGSWKEYQNIIVESSSGNLMIKAKTISNALGFNYKNYNGTYVIKRSSTRFNTYRKDKLLYTYTNGTVVAEKLASNVVYTDKTSKYNLCQVSTLSTLVNYKYFSTTNTNYHKNYTGIICYSKYNKIPTSVPVPELTPTKKPTSTPKPEPTTIIVEGVKFPVRNSFLPVDKALSDWGGAALIWSNLEKEKNYKSNRPYNRQ
jgi:ABC-type cobalt transport system substrate-binding protein